MQTTRTMPKFATILWSLLITAQLPRAQTVLRLCDLPTLPTWSEADGDGRVIAAFVLAAELPAHAFDAQADLDRRKDRGGTTRLGDGMAMMASKEIAETVGCRSWASVQVRTAGQGFLVDVYEIAIDDVTWQRRSSHLRALGDARGRILKAAYAASDLGDDEYRTLLVEAEATQLRSCSGGRAPRSVATIPGLAPTLPAIAACVLPELCQGETLSIAALDWRSGEVRTTSLRRDGPQWLSDGIRIEVDADGIPRSWSDAVGNRPRSRVDHDAKALRDRLVNGGAFRFGFRTAVSESIVHDRKGWSIPALGVTFDLRDDWRDAPAGMAPFDTLLNLAESDGNAVFRLQAKPVDPGTTLAEFTRPAPAVEVYGIKRFPIGKPETVKIDGQPALLERFTVNQLTVLFETHELRFVRDGVAYTLELQVPKKKAAYGKQLYQALLRSWRQR